MMCTKRLIYMVWVALLLAVSLQGQQIITPDEAILETIQNNFAVRLARQDINLAQNNASKIAAGYVPQINATGGPSMTFGGSRQELFNGAENIVENALSYGATTAVQGTYVLYDQTRAVTLNQLQEQLNLSNLQLRFAIEQSILQLIVKYYEVAQWTATAAVLREALDLSNRRLERVQYQYEFGQGVRLDMLNAQVDMQRDSINYYNTLQQKLNAERDLNVIMGRSVDATVAVDTTVLYRSLDVRQLESLMLSQNVEILLLDKNGEIVQLGQNMIAAEARPQLAANAAYTMSTQQNPEGAFIRNSTNRGLNVNFGLSWNLFDGGLRKLRSQAVKINLQTFELQREQLVLQLKRDLANAWENYQTALYIRSAERKNLETSRLNFERTEEQFNLGQTGSVEFRQAQLNLLDAANSYYNSRFSAKALEVILLQLAGMVI